MPYRKVTMIEVKEILRLWLAEIPKQGADVLKEERFEAILVALKASPDGWNVELSKVRRLLLRQGVDIR
jgi:hypothetical protein